jgi:hypothetical protein
MNAVSLGQCVRHHDGGGQTKRSQRVPAMPAARIPRKRRARRRRTER